MTEPLVTFQDVEPTPMARDMTLRDYAAIQFAAALLATPGHLASAHRHDERNRLAVDAADSIVRALSGG